MWIIDTVVVGADGPRVLTAGVKKDEGMYELGDVEEDEAPRSKPKPKAQSKAQAQTKKGAAGAGAGRGANKRTKADDDFIDDDEEEDEYEEESESEEEEKPRGRDRDRDRDRERAARPVDVTAPRALRERKHLAGFDEEAAQRKTHQRELARKLNDSAKDRLLNKKVEKQRTDFEDWDPVRTAPYQVPAEYPPEVKPNQIFIDAKKEVVFLPINGMSVPFQIGYIKNVSKTDISGWCELRINFHSAGQGLAAASKLYYPALKFPGMRVCERGVGVGLEWVCGSGGGRVGG